MSDRDELVKIREGLDYTQATMAGRLGMSVRAYSDLETGKSAVRPVHVMAAKFAALLDAVDQEDITAAPASVRNAALALADLIRGKPSEK